jgi:hypothetical protein
LRVLLNKTRKKEKKKTGTGGRNFESSKRAKTPC